MKRIITYMLAVLAAAPLFSQNTLTIHQKDGQQISLGFDEKPVVTFTDTTLVVKSAKTDVQYPLKSLSKLTFQATPTSADGIEADAQNPGVILSDYMVCISGAKAGITVSLADAGGKELRTYRTDADGSVSFSVADLPEGIYVVSSSGLTVKILKK